MTLKFALLGAGRIGKVHAKAISANPDADLVAVAWHPEDPALQQVAREIEHRVKALRPATRSLRIPLARDGDRYASLVNWIQVGRNLLLPVYGMTPPDALAQATGLLAEEGFRVHPLPSPTLALGGSLHCLTASIFV